MSNHGIFTIFLACLLCLVSPASAGSTPSIPDFAFPAKVQADSDSLLNVALNDANQSLALRQVLDLCVADALLEDDASCINNVSLIDSIIPKLSSPYSNLALLLEAQILQQEYSSNPGLYNSRNLPLESPFPADPMEWSGNMFKTRISFLVSQATHNLSDLPLSNINEISELITDPSEAEKINLTIPDFIYLKSLSLLPYTLNPKPYTLYPTPSPLVQALAACESLSIIPDSEKESFLKSEIAKLQDTEGEGLLLYEYWNRYARDSYSSYPEIVDWLNKYPDGFANSLLRYALAEMTRESISVQLPKTILPDTVISGNVSVSNLEKGYLLIYKLSPSQFTFYDEIILKKFPSSAKPIHILEIGQSGTIPFDYEKKISLPPLQEGLYAIIPSKTTSLPKDFNRASYNSNYATIRVSNISILTSCDSNTKGSGKVYVVDAHNNKPIPNASVSYFRDDSKSPRKILTTNSDGWVSIPAGYYRIEATYGKSVAKSEAGFNYSPVNNSVEYHTSIITDLAVFHPGDTVSFAVIGWQQEGTQNSIVKNSPVAVTLRDVNYIQVLSDTISLNEEGRAVGSFVIPEGRLLGTYFVTARFSGKPHNYESVRDILVEDYKLPSFLVTLEKLESPMPDVISFKGLASTYSGLPVPDASVIVKVDFLPWHWRFYGSNPSSSYQQSLSTGADGSFEVSLPISALTDTEFKTGRFSITADVTSLAGESQKSSPIIFYIGETYDIRPSIPDKVEISTDSVSLHIPVYDIAGLPINTPVKYKFTNIFNPSDSISGSFLSPSLSIPASCLSSGRYRLEFITDKHTSNIVTEATFWRNSDTRPPYPTPLWIPLTDYSYASSDTSIKVSFGSFYQDWLLCVISDGVKVIDTLWLQPSDTLHNLKIDIPSGSPTLFLSIMGLHDFKSESGVIKIVPANTLEKLNIHTESFRPDISAGNQEKWSFKFTIDDNPAPGVFAFASLSDKALNSILDFKWNLNIWSKSVYPKIRLNSQYIGNAVSTLNLIPHTSYPIPHTIIPDWQTYGYPLVSSAGFRFGGPVLYRSMAAKNAMVETALTSGAVMEDAEDEAVAESSQSETENTQLRPVEMPLAFFFPDLKADENGNLDISFTVPDFNTTWQFQLAAYNENLLNATLVLDAVASKPVMVRSNLPQFLRTGDKAQISATLYNNSADTKPVSGKIEILNTVSGELLASKDFPTVEVPPSGNRIVDIWYEVPDSVPYISVRSYAFADNSSDGEQGFVPILPSSAPVIESKLIYPKSGQDSFNLDLSDIPKDANVTVKYNHNPVWEVLLSLPSLKDDGNHSSLSIAKWLYGSLTALDIINSNSNYYDDLKAIFESEDSTITTSNLERDQYLKITALEATPWINDAYNETARIRSLSQYLYPDNVQPVINAKIDALKALQNPDGGFSWFESMKSSPYFTSQVISVFGYLNSQNLLSSSLESMARKAVKYCDSNIEETAKQSPSFNPLSLLDYLYVRNMLQCPKSAYFKKLETQCCDSILKHWQYWSPVQKAKGAIVLLAYGHYDNEVINIVSSVEEFVNTRLSLSDQALILDLFSSVVEDHPEIGESTFLSSLENSSQTLREKMFLKKETTDWASLPDAAGIIYSLLSSSLPEQNSNIPVPRRGYIWLTPPLSPLGGLTSPIYIITQFVKPIKDIKAVKSDNLAIEKHLYIQDSKGKLKETKELRKGDKVTVILNLTCLKDMDYVSIVDSRSAALQPEDQVSGMVNIDGIYAYREFRFDKTSFFIEHLPAGKYVISYDCYVDRAGEYSLGIANAQSLYSPSQSAHSAGSALISKL